MKFYNTACIAQDDTELGYLSHARGWRLSVENIWQPRTATARSQCPCVADKNTHRSRVYQCAARWYRSAAINTATNKRVTRLHKSCDQEGSAARIIQSRCPQQSEASEWPKGGNVNVNVNVNQKFFSVALTAKLSRRPRQRRQQAKTE